MIHVPASGYDIGGGYEVLVLYASTQRITLKYTLEDNVVEGYTLHIEHICVDPTLLALYERWNDAGRSQLPDRRLATPGRAKSELSSATQAPSWIPVREKIGGSK